MITDRDRAEVRASWPKPSLASRMLVALEAAEAVNAHLVAEVERLREDLRILHESDMDRGK